MGFLESMSVRLNDEEGLGDGGSLGLGQKKAMRYVLAMQVSRRVHRCL